MRKWLVILSCISLMVALAAPSVRAVQSHRFTVAFKADRLPEGAEQVVAEAGGRVVESLPELGVMTIEGPPGTMGMLLRHPQVLAVSPQLELKLTPARFIEAEVEPDDANTAAADLYNAFQWDIKQVTGNGASWALGQGSKSTVVGIIDTGINRKHAALAGNLLGGRNFTPDGPGGTVDPADIEDRHGHGSHVAGTIAGHGRILGVGPHLGVRAYRVFGASGGSPSMRIVHAILAAANDGVDVINMSLGGFDLIAWGFWTAPDGTVYRFRDLADFVAMQRAVLYATQAGTVVVASAGNDALNIANPTLLTHYLNMEYGPLGYTFIGATRKTPASLPGVVTVSATGPDSALSSYSNYGPGAIDLAAPGGDFLRWPTGDWYTDMNLSAYRAAPGNVNRYAWMAGTSMAAPKVSAVAALVIDQARTAGESLKPQQVVVRMQQTAADLGKPGYDPVYGHGMVNAYSALGGH